MAIITTTVAAVDFGGVRGDGTISTTTATTVRVGHHQSSGLAGWAGFRFPIPEHIDPSLIISVKLKLRCLNAVYPHYSLVRIQQGNAAPFETTGVNRVDTRYAAVTSVGQVEWTTEPTVSVSNADYRTNNLKTLYDNAFVAAGGTGHVAVMCSGGGGRNSAPTWGSPTNATTANRPVLEIEWDSPAVNASVTTTAPSISLATTPPTTYNKINDINYHDGIGFNTNRFLDVYLPSTEAPPGGWPVAMFVHGGAFMGGSENDIASATRWLNDTLNSGFAIVSVRYKLTNGELNIFANGGLGTNTGWTRPHSVEDVLCATKWIDTQTNHDLNPDLIVGVGYSAGGHLVMEAALLAEDATPNAYNANWRGYQSPAGSRYEDWPNLYHAGNPARTGIPTFKGVFTFGGPWDLPSLWPQNFLLTAALNLYYGAYYSSEYVRPGVLDEGNLGSFIQGSAGTIYEPRSATPPSFPIAISYATGDSTVPTFASYTPMRASLEAVGYDVSQDTNQNVASGVALSRYGYEDTFHNGGGHDGLMVMYSTDFYTGWLDEVTTLNSGSTNFEIEAPQVITYTVSEPNVSITQATTNVNVSAPSLITTIGNLLAVNPKIHNTSAIMDQSHITTGGTVNAEGPLPALSGTFDISVSDDAGYWNEIARLTESYFQLGYHWSAASRGWGGFRFPIPDGLNANDIVDARLILTPRLILDPTFRTVIRVEQGNAAPFEATGTNRPDNRFNAVPLAGETLWDYAPVLNTPSASPDISEKVKTAIPLAGENGYIGIHCGSGTGMNKTMQVYSSSSAYYPRLQITLLSSSTSQATYFNGTTETAINLSYWNGTTEVSITLDTIV